jgi:AraC family transcriptional regulator of adaptative response/methylated-DNA-[protein]-cysteine methyltransferase
MSGSRSNSRAAKTTAGEKHLDRRWLAVAERDRAADGTFVYAVTTTGIYCRPSCPSKRPKRANVVYFDTPRAAAAAGFRDCKRCNPIDPESDVVWRSWRSQHWQRRRA